MYGVILGQQEVADGVLRPLRAQAKMEVQQLHAAPG